MDWCNATSKDKMMGAKEYISEIKILSLKLSRLLNGLIRSLYQSSRFGIRRGYIHRSSVEPHDDRGLEDTFQKEVYQKAASLMRHHQWDTVLDIGCGSGFKLAHYLGQYKATGVDYPPAIEQSRLDYPDLTWINADDFVPEHQSAALILCADVIEHVRDPDALMKSLLSVRNWKCIMISTPERNRRRGRWHFGPPPNPAHYREWSMPEFNKFISAYCPVNTIEIINTQQHTQLVICMRD
jgi:SAM-dependent methyltransferase